MAYGVVFTRSAERSLAALPRTARLRIEAAIAGYAADPHRRRGARKVGGCPADRPRYRRGVGDCRATFRIVQDRLVVCVVAAGTKGGFEY